MYYVLLYEYVQDVAQRRAPFRERHLALLRDLHATGIVFMAGAWADPLGGAAIVFNAPTAQPAEEFVKADPYVTNGLVPRWRIREWTVVVGGGAL